MRIKEALKIVYPAAITMITGYFASGLGDGVANMMGSLIRQFIPLIPVAWLLAKTMGIDVVWYAIWISEICGALYAIVRIWRLLKRKFTEI